VDILVTLVGVFFGDVVDGVVFAMVAVIVAAVVGGVGGGGVVSFFLSEALWRCLQEGDVFAASHQTGEVRLPRLPGALSSFYLIARQL
jgi:hypothetical protein